MDEISNLPERAKELLQKIITENKRLQMENQGLTKKVRELSLVYEMSQLLNENSEGNDFYLSILQMALRVTDSEVGLIFLNNPMTNRLMAKVSIGEIDQKLYRWLAEIPFEIGRTLATGKIVELINQEPLLTEFQRRDPFIKSVLFFPLRFSQENLGLGIVMHRHFNFSNHSIDYGEDIRFLTILAQQASMMAEFNRLKLEQKSQQLYFKTIAALTEAIDAKDMYTAGHSQRVAEISTSIAYELGLTQKEIDTIHYGALLHDIGKIGIPETILNKKGRLTNDEFFNIKRHPVIGTTILRSIDFLDDALYIVRYHHERFDGLGYPEGIKGEEIPFMARIVGVADAWDAMTSNRAYRKALPIATAIEELEINKGTQFDPYIINTIQSGSFVQLKKM